MIQALDLLPLSRWVHDDSRFISRINQLRAKSATINVSYYQPFIKAQEAGDGEPTDAQAVYKTLDPVMLAVLTEQNADISALLKTAAANVNQILSNSGG